MPNPVPAAATGLPPRRLKIEKEFLSLMNQRQRINARLDELVVLLGTAPTRLPKSGLRLVSSRPGSLTLKGGRDHG